MQSLRFPTIASLLALSLSACLIVAGCDRTPTEPTGQVVATVNGHEITQSELAAESGNISPALSPNARRSIEQAALQNIIARYILADAARQAKLDSTPLAAILERGAKEQALVELVQRKLRRDLPLPSREEAAIYASDHPASFTRRHIFLVDQYVARDVPPSVLKLLEPLDTLEQVGEVLTQNKVAFSRTVGVIDALTIDPDAAEQIANLPPGAVFVSPDGGTVRINRIRETDIDPILGDDAIRIAQELIQNKRSAELLNKQITRILNVGSKGVRYNPSYRPTPAATAKPGMPPSTAVPVATPTPYSAATVAQP